MAINTIALEIEPCIPDPPNGYRVSYRLLGSDDAYRVWPENFLGPEISFDVEDDPAGSEYEGFVQGDCGNDELGIRVPFATAVQDSASDSGSGSSGEGQRVRNLLNFASITAMFTIPDTGGPSDTRPISVSGGYPILAGESRDGTIHADHDGMSNLEVIVYLSGLIGPSQSLRVTDSDGGVQCQPGGAIVPIVGTLVGQRLDNDEDWQILLSETAC